MHVFTSPRLRGEVEHAARLACCSSMPQTASIVPAARLRPGLAFFGSPRGKRGEWSAARRPIEAALARRGRPCEGRSPRGAPLAASSSSAFRRAVRPRAGLPGREGRSLCPVQRAPRSAVVVPHGRGPGASRVRSVTSARGRRTCPAFKAPLRRRPSWTGLSGSVRARERAWISWEERSRGCEYGPIMQAAVTTMKQVPYVHQISPMHYISKCALRPPQKIPKLKVECCKL